MNDAQCVIKAIENTKKYFPEEWEALLAASFDKNYFQFEDVHSLESAILKAHWKCCGSRGVSSNEKLYIAVLPGLASWVNVKQLSDDALLEMQKEDNMRATFILRSIYRDVSVRSYVKIGRKDERDIVLDVKPGEQPVSITAVPISSLSEKKGKQYISKKEALELGVKWIRVL